MRPNPSQIGLTLLALCALAPGTLAQTPPPQPAPASSTSGPTPAGTTEAPALEEQIAALRRELQALEQEIESLGDQTDAETPEDGPAASRLADLERRLEEVEAELARLRREATTQRSPASTGPRGPADPVGLDPYNLAGDSGQVTAGRSFNPAISVIPDGVYYNDSRDGEAGEIASGADGFHAHGGGDGHGHSHGGAPARGFSLREVELTFSGSVDPYFEVWAIFAVAGGEFEVEETYVLTRSLPAGLQLKAGKFYSGIGYINSQHPHQWDFVDQALPWDLVFGGALNEVGVQLNWVPDLPVYTKIGLEAGQGDNERVSAQLADGDETPFFREVAGPRLFTGFVKVAPDVGYSSAFQGGFFAGYSRNHQELHDEDGDGVFDEALEGTSTFFGTDWVYRYDSGKQYGKGDLTVQAEYLYRVKDMGVVAEAGEPVAAGPPVKFTGDGLYAQAVYGFASRWTAGARFDVVGLTNRIEEGSERHDLDSSRRFSASLTFNPTEFSRLRVQWTHGDFAVDGSRESFDEVWVQFQMSLGAHGAHAF